MSVVAFLRIGPTSTAAEMLVACHALADAGVAGVAFLDAEDLGVPVSSLESSTLATLAALEIRGTGVIGSQSALYGYPFHTARRFATLDHLAAGFSGWLMRTGSAGPEARAHGWRSDGVLGQDLARAAEHAEVAFRLWDSWEDGAQWPDKESGNFKDDSRIHPIEYVSERFQVEGPLDVPPSPQRRPVVFTIISSSAQVRALAPWVDVAVVRAPGAAAATALVGAVRADGGIPRILIAAEDGGVGLATAEQLVRELGVDGIAPFIDPTEVSAVASLSRPLDRAPRTLAERLDLGVLATGGRLS